MGKLAGAFGIAAGLMGVVALILKAAEKSKGGEIYNMDNNLDNSKTNNVYIPEGEELLRCLNEGCKICNECGAIMELDPSDLEYDLVCPNCGFRADSMEYEYDWGEERELAPNMIDMFGEDIPPECCIACGGPYPDCMTSCNIFDD